MHGTYWEFDRIQFKPLKMKYLGINEDKSVRFTYVGAPPGHQWKFASFPQSKAERLFFKNRTDCLRNAIQQLLQQF